MEIEWNKQFSGESIGSVRKEWDIYNVAKECSISRDGRVEPRHKGSLLLESAASR